MAKKGIPAWGRILIGCGGITLLGLILAVGLGAFGFMKAKEFIEEGEKKPCLCNGQTHGVRQSRSRDY